MLAALAGAPAALADGCGIPDSGPIWVDFAGHDAPIPAKPGLVLAVASGHRHAEADARAGRRDRPLRPQLQQARRHDGEAGRPATMEATAKSFYDYAVSVTGCETPIIAENELFGAQTPTPWSDDERPVPGERARVPPALSALGARPLLSVANPPFTGGDAAEWWRAGLEGGDPPPPGLLHLAERQGPLGARAGGREPDDARRACAGSSTS